ncbi:MAG: bifunctional methionine sulfoxide reductase B/A protein [Pseudomonadota bacterium]|nr:bifunctional methionine sulfoxide reductase B/A protein [Pseudomonadota bacterium]
MLSWKDIMRFAEKGNPEPERTVRKTDEEWQARLTPEQHRVTRRKGTEMAFSSEMCGVFEPGVYRCVCCDTVLFDSAEKFDSGSGWPSFTQPVRHDAIAYHADNAYGMQRIETTCNTCEAHLGHVFPDGPGSGGLRFCMNAVALGKTGSSQAKATFGGGCFWCTEAVFQQIEGVISVESGYSGGHSDDPDYHRVCSGDTGHAEVVQVVFDPSKISYADLLRIHLGTHDPTTPNRQGADRGTQYRSIILAHDEEQDGVAREVLGEVARYFDNEIVTEVTPFETFYKAEGYHQNYYADNPGKPYCSVVISPKLKKLTSLYRERLKSQAPAE